MCSKSPSYDRRHSVASYAVPTSGTGARVRAGVIGRRLASVDTCAARFIRAATAAVTAAARRDAPAESGTTARARAGPTDACVHFRAAIGGRAIGVARADLAEHGTAGPITDREGVEGIDTKVFQVEFDFLQGLSPKIEWRAAAPCFHDSA
jgi:hypothetical protein